MFGLLKYGLVTLLWALAMFQPIAASADSNPSNQDLQRALQGNTLKFIDPGSDILHQVYFGRFGDDYERYVPCTVSDGTWRVSSGGLVCLKDRLPPHTQICFKPAISPPNVSVSFANGTTSADAKLYPGYKLPHG